ncbi:HAD family acid phosphatase [Sphingomonas sp. ACRSK]|uniref:HAD family acid phosphatase n=1 Tax=Sphingomonas sp. ACRSK TaxID=2918213 RepID=UPI001EF4CCA0|nr:HAD family acid phosphatase [Sphingomonas sp. ACRSK]MCG7347117.1 acid phosphatase [Sphingomonas sp. ACRSK]
MMMLRTGQRLAFAGISATALLLPGCVAAVPVGAAAVIGKNVVFPGGGEDENENEKAEDAEKAARKQARELEREQRRQAKREAKRREQAEEEGSPPALQATTAPTRPAMAAAGTVPAGMQYLYGSGEAAALSSQAYRALAQHVRASADYRQAGIEVASVVLAPGSSLASPHFVECGAKPLAIVLDIDETVLLNLGYEADEAARGLSYDDARWRRWEATGAGKVDPVPGAVEAISAARRAGVAVVYISNRTAANAPATTRALEGAGLGKAIPGETLLLKEEGAGSGKDARRAQVAETHCVVALVGDQLGDFSDLFSAPGMTPAARRAAADGVQIEPLWGAGWFMLPNPVYGTGLKGGIADVFPANRRWTDPGAAAAAGVSAATPKE